MKALINKWYNKFIVIDRHENSLSLWESFRRRLWSLQYQKQYRDREVKYGYDHESRSWPSETFNIFEVFLIAWLVLLWFFW